MKKTIAAITALCLASAFSFTGCGSDTKTSETENSSVQNSAPETDKSETPETEDVYKDSEPFSVVCTIFPEYDWVKEILGDHADNAEITYLLDNGSDLHNYQPTANDMIKISDCDLFIYVGGESDEWVEGALAEAKNPDMQVINLLETMGDAAKEEEIVEGMQGEEEEEEDDEEEETEYDEHVWLSLRNAQTLCDEIESRLEIIDPSNASDYKANLESYKGKLSELDQKFSDTVKSSSVKTILFGDRFPFRYFADDYGLDYYAAFVGCSAETEASFETVVFLAQKVDELGLGTVFTIENSDGKIADTVIRSTKSQNAQVLQLNSLQSVTLKDGATYLSVMEENLETLKKALN